MKKNKLIKLLVILLVCTIFTACGPSKVTTIESDDEGSTKVTTDVTNTKEDTDSKEETDESVVPEETTEAPVEETETEDKSYGLGDLITVSQDGKDMYCLSIDSVTTTDERSEYAETEPEQVVVIGYSYWNIGSEDDVYISDYDFKVIDGDKNVCEAYPGTIYDYPTSTPVGTKCSAQLCYGLNAKSENIQLHFYDNITGSASDFIIDLPADGVSKKNHDDVVTFKEPSDFYKVGDTITVKGESGDYDITINSAKKVKERNEYASQDVKAVWVLDYTYENTGSDEDLYISDSQCIAVDENGQVGASYPGEIQNYPQDTPKGTKCTAEMCFGTKSDTDNIYIYFYDNMFNYKADMVVKVTDK